MNNQKLSLKFIDHLQTVHSKCYDVLEISIIHCGKQCILHHLIHNSSLHKRQQQKYLETKTKKKLKQSFMQSRNASNTHAQTLPFKHSK